MNIKTKSKESLKSLYNAFENLAKKMGKEFKEQLNHKERKTQNSPS